MIIDHSMSYAHAMSYAHTMSYTYRMINTHDTYEQTELSNINISLKISDVCLCSVTILVMPPKADYVLEVLRCSWSGGLLPDCRV